MAIIENEKAKELGCASRLISIVLFFYIANLGRWELFQTTLKTTKNPKSIIRIPAT